MFMSLNDVVNIAYCVIIGKTHTMTGDRESEINKGIIPRSVELIIEQIIHMRSIGCEVSATYSMLEVYNESLNDLLVPHNTNNNFVSDKNKLKISMTDRVIVHGITSIEMNTECVESGICQLNGILHQASKARTTAATLMNEVTYLQFNTYIIS